ncbi:MAG: Gldg family protein [Oscillospiraceae bacterium]|nr:Gldg family protein [Oscillospiraceae bacterium]
MSFRNKIQKYIDLRKNKRGIRDRRSGALKKYAIGSVIVMIAIMIVINLLASLLLSDVKIDMTTIRMSDITPETRRVLSELTEEVEIIGLFDNPDNPQSSFPAYSLFDPLIDEYVKASAGKLKVTIVDPDTSRAYISSIDPTGSTTFSKETFIIRSKDRFSVINPYDCLGFDDEVFSTTGQYVLIANRIESVFTGTISYLTEADIIDVYFLKGHQELNNRIVSQLLLYDGYNSHDLYLDDAGAIPDDCEMIVINNPRIDITAKEAGLLKQFLADGNELIIICDYLSADKNMSELSSVAERMGILLTSDLITEFSADYLFSPNNNSVSKGKIADGFQEIFGVDFVRTGNSRSVQISNIINPELMVRPIISSSGFAKIDIEGQGSESGLTEGFYHYAVLSVHSGTNGSLAVIGTGFFSADEYLAAMGSNEANTNLFRNLVRSMTGREAVTAIPMKLNPSYIFQNPQAVSQQTLWSVILIAIIPFILFCVGMIVYYRRRHL